MLSTRLTRTLALEGRKNNILVNAEVRAGVPSTEALKHLAERTGLEDIRGRAGLFRHAAAVGPAFERFRTQVSYVR